MLKRLCLIFLLVTPCLTASAQEDATLDRLIKALQLPEIFDVMREEGLAYGRDLDRELLQGAGGKVWQQAVSDIYEPDRIWRSFKRRFATDMAGQDLAAMTAFFASDLGLHITTLELKARRVMLDKAREQASREAYHAMLEEAHPRLVLLKALVRANDLVEYNVMGAMNANLAFYTGMIEGDAFDYDVSQQQVLQDVWSQEAEIRLDTETWIYAYLLLAYAPLTDAQLQAYVDFSDTTAGRALNTALFAGYGEVFSTVSKALGLSAAQLMQAEAL